jgi:hypothetical protein
MDKDTWFSFAFDVFKPSLFIMEIHKHIDNQEGHTELQDRLYSFNYKFYDITGPSLVYKQITI